MMKMIMVMVRDYVSELRPTTDLLFIPQVIHDHGEARWMMSSGENSRSVHQSALWKYYLHSYLVPNQEDVGEGNNGFCLGNTSFILADFFYMPKNLGTWGLRHYFTSKGSRAAEFYRP
jgi:hypothetical protein